MAGMHRLTLSFPNLRAMVNLTEQVRRMMGEHKDDIGIGVKDALHDRAPVAGEWVLKKRRSGCAVKFLNEETLQVEDDQ